jgi:hypothetical protein
VQYAPPSMTISISWAVIVPSTFVVAMEGHAARAAR